MLPFTSFANQSITVGFLAFVFSIFVIMFQFIFPQVSIEDGIPNRAGQLRFRIVGIHDKSVNITKCLKKSTVRSKHVILFHSVLNVIVFSLVYPMKWE